MKQDKLILLDFDGTLWGLNPFALAFENEFNRVMKKYGIDVRFMDFSNIHRALTKDGVLNVKGDLQKIYFTYHKFFIEPYVNINPENAFHILYNYFLEHVKRTKFRPYSLRVLDELKNKYYIVGLTNGYYDFEVGVINKKIGNFKKIMHTYYTPQKLFRELNVKNPFKPELNIVKSVINHYKFDDYILIGDHPRADGLLAKCNKLTVYLLTKYPNNIDRTIESIHFRRPSPEEANMIRQLYYEGRIILVSSWKKIASEIDS